MIFRGAKIFRGTNAAYSPASMTQTPGIRGYR
jgi:hypothetical protein